MKIWVLSWTPPEDSGIWPRVVGVYTSAEKADEEARKFDDKSFSVDEVDINAPARPDWPP